MERRNEIKDLNFELNIPMYTKCSNMRYLKLRNIHIFLKNIFGNHIVISVNFFLPIIAFYKVSITTKRKRSYQIKKLTNKNKIPH